MKKLALIAALLLFAASAAVSAQDYGLPELHVIKTVTLAQSGVSTISRADKSTCGKGAEPKAELMHGAEVSLY